jgi:hypothetical protein
VTSGSATGTPSRPRQRRAGARLSATDRVGQLLCLVYFATYVATNASTTYEPSTSPARHLVMLAIALFSLFTAPGKALLSLAVFSPLVVLYAVADLPTYALMAAIAALSLPVVSRVLVRILNDRNRRVPLLLLGIALLPAVSALLQGELDVLWSYQYSRGRLLLGYFHPKEAAICFGLPMLLYLLMLGKASLRGVPLLLPAALWLVGSRNVALTFYVLLSLRRFPRATVAVLILGIVALAAVLLLLGDAFDIVNEATSLRLAVWMDALSDPSDLAGDELLLGSRLAVDSYYIELLTSVGMAGLVAFVGWAAVIYRVLGARAYRSEAGRPLFLSILFFSAFDSGIVSTGNALHVCLWALAMASLFTDRPARRRSQAPPKPSAPSVGPAPDLTGLSLPERT